MTARRRRSAPGYRGERREGGLRPALREHSARGDSLTGSGGNDALGGGGGADTARIDAGLDPTTIAVETVIPNKQLDRPVRETSGVRAIVPLDSEPRFRPFPFATPLEGPLRRAVDDAALVLSRTKGRFDGRIALCHGVSRDGAILRRHGRYAEAMVVFAEPTQAYRLGFALGVQLFVQQPGGQTLFQQRGPSIGRDPLLWTASASGGLGHSEQPCDAVLADAAEEIGLGTDDLPGFRPIAIVVSDDTGSALVVYHAGLREGAEPAPDPVKVAALSWAASPAELGAQVSADTVASWEALELWRARQADAAAQAR